MKKILSIGLVAAAMLTSASAGSLVDKSSVDFTVGTFEFDGADKGISLGMDVKGEKQVLVDGLYVGAGINAEIFDPGNVNSMDDDLGLVADIYPTISYDVTKDVSVNVMYGYTIGQVGSETFDGTTVGAGIDYKINKDWLVGVNYKKSDLEFTTGNVEVDAERMNVSVAYKF